MTAQALKAGAVLLAAVATTRRETAKTNRWVAAGRFIPLILFFLLWQLASNHVLDPFFFSRPLAIWHAAMVFAAGGKLLTNLATTGEEVVAGYVAGTIVGMVAAIVFGLSARAYAIVEPLLLALFAVPTIALAPLIIVWFGIGISSKIVIAAYFVFFIVFLNTIAGVRSVPRGWITSARVMGASRLQTIVKVIVPGAMPHIVTGLKTGLPQAVVGAIVGEFMSAQRGIGYLIVDASGRYDTASVFAAIGILAALVAVMVIALQAGTAKRALG